MNIKIHEEIKATPEIDWGKPGQLLRSINDATLFVITTGGHLQDRFDGSSLDGYNSDHWCKHVFVLHPHPLTISNFPIPEEFNNLVNG